MGYYKELEILDRYIRNGRGNMNIPPIYKNKLFSVGSDLTVDHLSFIENKNFKQ